MFNEQELKERNNIIQLSTVEDILILDENYTQLLKDAYNSEERDQLRYLKTLIKDRINEQ